MSVKLLAKELKKYINSLESDDILVKKATKTKKVLTKKIKKTTDLTQKKSVKSVVSFAKNSNQIQNNVVDNKVDENKNISSVAEKLVKQIDEIKTTNIATPKQNNSTLKLDGDKATNLETIAKQICTCKRCPLGESRIKAVIGEGNINAKLMFVGEGPGFDEDREGRPFVGRAGQLLDKMIVAMGFTREEVYIANMVKCHPMVDPKNRDKHGNDRPPTQTEIAYCRRYIENQIAQISPDFIVALGAVAGKSLIKNAKSFSEIRGKFYDLQLTQVELKKPIKILATFHPAALLRNPNWKRPAWEELKLVVSAMGRKLPQNTTKQG